MTLSDRLFALAQLTLQTPRRAVHVLLAEGVPMRARTAGLALVAVASALLASVQVILDPVDLTRGVGALFANPLQIALVEFANLALSVVLIDRVGRAFGGRGNFADALLIMVWLNLLYLVPQVLQLVISLFWPNLAALVAIIGTGLYLWLLTHFIAELHGFASRGLVFLGMVLTCLAAGLVLGVLLILILGPEAFVNV